MKSLLEKIRLTKPETSPMVEESDGLAASSSCLALVEREEPSSLFGQESNRSHSPVPENLPLQDGSEHVTAAIERKLKEEISMDSDGFPRFSEDVPALTKGEAEEAAALAKGATEEAAVPSFLRRRPGALAAGDPPSDVHALQVSISILMSNPKKKTLCKRVLKKPTMKKKPAAAPPPPADADKASLDKREPWHKLKVVYAEGHVRGHTWWAQLLLGKSKS